MWSLSAFCGVKLDVDRGPGQLHSCRMRQPLILALALTTLAACGGAPGPETAPSPTRGATGGARAAVIRGTPSIPSSWTVHSAPVTARKAMVVSAHPLASAAGIEVMKEGGNAIDAAVAVGFALAVVLPDAGNIGGGGFIVHRSASGEVQAIDYREMAPSGASHDMYLDSAGNVTEKSLTGHLASGVPGSVAGMYEAWKRGGSLPWATLLAPAIRLANGHRVDAERSGDIRGDSDRLAQFPASRAQFLPGGQAPAAGTLWKQADLARTLQLISDSGPDVFYRGQIADLIVAEMERGHSFITKDH